MGKENSFRINLYPDYTEVDSDMQENIMVSSALKPSAKDTDV